MTAPAPDLPTEVSLAADFEPGTQAQWRALVDRVLKGADFDKRLVSRTADGLAVAPLYTREHVPAGAADRRPGVPPYTRGSAGRVASQGWRIAQPYAEPDPAVLAAEIREDQAGGVEAITIRIEAPGQSGLPADREALEAALADVPLAGLKVSLEPGAHAVHAAQALTSIAEAKGAVGSIARLGIDPLGTLARTGELTLLRRDRPGFMPGLPWLPAPGTTLVADGRPYHEAGASEAQELAALVATLVAYLRCLEAEGQAPVAALPRIALTLAADADLFLTIAKLRAARQLVWRVADACGAGDAAGRMPLAVTTSERMMSRRDPWVNMLRVTTACAAVAMGGADEIAVLPFTWALGRPDAFARRIARNVGLVLREEAALGRVIDPAGGAFAVERLTADLVGKAWEIFQAWEAAGGMLAALTSGLVQDQVAAVAAQRDAAIATGRIALTGTSAFPQLGDDGVTVVPWGPVPPITAVPVGRPLVARRLAEPFERLRDKADAAVTPPRMFLAALGTPADHGARSSWITNFLAAGGIAAIANDGFTNSADVGRVFADSGAAVACICSSDQVYAELAEAATMALKGAGAKTIYLAGRPAALEQALRGAGVDGFLFAGQDAVVALTSILEQAR